MAGSRVAETRVETFGIHDEGDDYDMNAEDELAAQDNDTEDALSVCESQASDESDCLIDDSVVEDMQQFETTFKGISDRFRLINRIGEGTFSTVYKAEDLLYEHFDNNWDIDEKENSRWSSPPFKRRRVGDASSTGSSGYSKQRRRPRYVAIKKIYVTSSPSRIQNELALLHDLRGCDSVCPLITAFRHQDQVVAVLPYFRHVDFRDYFREFTVSDMRFYFHSLFTALAAVHKHNILHRDIKPTNFLYDIGRRRGVLVDFGLAEREGTDTSYCLCQEPSTRRREKINSSVAAQQPRPEGYLKNDSRPSRRANRAGTRGFRAPEVLLKCTMQTTKIDIWSAGVILLTILCRRFPFFNSTDDVEAMIEIATIFGYRKMKSCALLHGQVFDTTIPTIGEKGFTFEKIILWSTCRLGAKEKEVNEGRLSNDDLQAIRFLSRCLELEPRKRISAEEALRHEFLTATGEGASDEDEINMI